MCAAWRQCTRTLYPAQLESKLTFRSLAKLTFRSLALEAKQIVWSLALEAKLTCQSLALEAKRAAAKWRGKGGRRSGAAGRSGTTPLGGYAMIDAMIDPAAIHPPAKTGAAHVDALGSGRLGPGPI